MDIANLPYQELQFDKKGKCLNPFTLPQTSDVIVISHGWNNNYSDARDLYKSLLSKVAPHVLPLIPHRSFAIIGVLWPSKALDIKLRNTDVSTTSAASIGIASPASSADIYELDHALNELRSVLSMGGEDETDSELVGLIDQARRQTPALASNEDSQITFLDNFKKGLENPLYTDAKGEQDDCSNKFFAYTASEILDKFTIDELDSKGGTDSAAGIMMPHVHSGTIEGGAAGLFKSAGRLSARIINSLNYLSYYVMKARAGKVGKDGLAPIIDKLSEAGKRVHLIGHSFGGRLVTAAARATAKPIASMTLLQAAFSHNGFSEQKGGYFVDVVKSKKVSGRLVVTHSVHDKAVGIAYPLASRLSGDTTMALGDATDKFGGIGRNGALHMAPVTVHSLLLDTDVPDKYQLEEGIYNVDSESNIKDHGDVTNKYVAALVAAAIR